MKADGPKNSIDPALFEGGHTGKTEQGSPERAEQVLGAVRIWPSEAGKDQIALWEDDLKRKEKERWAARYRSNAEAAKARREASKAKREAGKDESGRGQPKVDHEARKAGAQATKAEHEARTAGAEAGEAEGLAKLGGKPWLLRILIANAATGIGVVTIGAITKSTEALLAGVAIISGTSASAIGGLVKSPPSDKNQGPSP